MVPLSDNTFAAIGQFNEWQNKSACTVPASPQCRLTGLGQFEPTFPVTSLAVLEDLQKGPPAAAA